jgi:hypothetical protein
MKILLSDYVGSLKERGELDAILPDLLSERGFHVISRPGIGVIQHGVDVAAVGKDDDGVRKLFLFSVKAGDLTRSEWDNGIQALRPSLNEILDIYIRNRIPPQYKALKIVICVVIGGVVQQSVQLALTSYFEEHSTRKISFQEWNGDRLADMMLLGLLQEKLLPKPLRSSFQKAVAMVDQPDVSFEHFTRLLFALQERAVKDKERVLVARQINICLWVLFVWAREIDNFDAPYRASELALLHIWDLLKPFLGKKGANAIAMSAAFHQLVRLHTIVAGLFLERKILPYVGKKHALSFAVNSAEPTDVNLKMFDVLGRLALTGHWMIWLGRSGGQDLNAAQIAGLRKHVSDAFSLIVNNPSLFLPLMDEQAIELALFLALAVQVGRADADVKGWLAEMVRRLKMTVMSHGRYPAALTDYADVLAHPKARTDEYQREVTSGSVLIPLLLAFVAALGDAQSITSLEELIAGPLAHCTLQLWTPDEGSEKHLYLNDAVHGVALTDLPTSGSGQDLIRVLAEASKNSAGFNGLSAIKFGYFPLILTACRHYRLPVPPPFWIPLLVPQETGSAAAV